MKSRQQGLVVVEFAVAGGVALMVLFACIEIGRLFYVLNTLAESTRRSARLAAVCPLDDPAVIRSALLLPAGAEGDSRLLSGLKAENIQIAYLDEAGAAVAAIPAIRYVRVAIVDYEHELMIPFIGGTLDLPSFATTLPAESLGWVPELGARVCLSGEEPSP